MKHYLNTVDQKVYSFESDGSQDFLISNNMQFLTKEQAIARLAPIETIPIFVEMVQARLALLHAGHLATVKAAIAAMPGIEGEEARETWEFAPRVRRDSNLVAAMGVLLSLTDKQLDDLFLDAATR